MKKVEDQIKARVTDWSDGMIEIKPVLRLVGEDGNAFAILGMAFRAAREAGWTKEQIQDYKAKATAGDYNTLLRATMECFDVE